MQGRVRENTEPACYIESEEFKILKRMEYHSVSRTGSNPPVCAIVHIPVITNDWVAGYEHLNGAPHALTPAEAAAGTGKLI